MELIKFAAQRPWQVAFFHMLFPVATIQIQYPDKHRTTDKYPPGHCMDMPGSIAASTELMRCPNCKRLIPAVLRVCEHCGHVIVGNRSRKQSVRITNVTIKNSVLNKSSVVIEDGGGGDVDVRVEDSVLRDAKIAGAAQQLTGRGDCRVVGRGSSGVCPVCGRRLQGRYGFCEHCNVQVA